MIRAIPLFSGLSAVQVAWLAEQVVVRTYAKDAMVFLEGDPSPGMFWLHTGWLKAIKLSTKGREQILQFFEAGSTFHEIGGFSDHPNPATAVALSDVEVWLFPRAAMMELLEREPGFALHVIRSLGRRIQSLVDLVEDLSLRPVIERLARLILDGAEDGSLPRPRWYTQNELAARLGTVPDVVQRTLRGMELDGLIEVERRQIRIIDPVRLDDIAAG